MLKGESKKRMGRKRVKFVMMAPVAFAQNGLWIFANGLLKLNTVDDIYMGGNKDISASEKKDGKFIYRHILQSACLCTQTLMC